MAKRKARDPKTEALRQRGCLNPNPEKVADPLFSGSDFFDPRDSVQVKYEMVRRVKMDGRTVSDSAAAFGFSRPSFYQAQTLLEAGGLVALAPQKPGPRRSHKLDADVMSFLEKLRSEDSSLGAPELARRIRERFGLKVHPRSIERAFARQEKKRP
jgi:transposase